MLIAIGSGVRLIISSLFYRYLAAKVVALGCYRVRLTVLGGAKLRKIYCRQNAMFQHDLEKENAYRFSRFDGTHLLSTSSPHPIELEGKTWTTVEHYVQSQLARSEDYARRIRKAETAEEAHALGNSWFRRKRANWKSLRRVLMTRALYTKAQMYGAVREALLETGDELILEVSLYDYYWGIGRDQRGENMLGKVWMDVRSKLREPAENQHAQD